MENESLIIEYKQIIRTVQELLSLKIEWIDRYRGYADLLIKNQDPVSVLKNKFLKSAFT